MAGKRFLDYSVGCPEISIDFYQVFATCNIAAALLACALPETKDLSLEQMDVLFGVVDERTRHRHIETNMQAMVEGLPTSKSA